VAVLVALPVMFGVRVSLAFLVTPIVILDLLHSLHLFVHEVIELVTQKWTG